MTGQTLEILVENSPNEQIQIQKPDGSYANLTLDSYSQAKLFLDQEGLWKIIYENEVQTFYVHSKGPKLEQKEPEDLSLFFIFGIIAVFIFVAVLLFVALKVYKNLIDPGARLIKSYKANEIIISFRAGKDLVENVLLSIYTKDKKNPTQLKKEKLLPYESLFFSCQKEEFVKAVCTWQEKNVSFSSSIIEGQDNAQLEKIENQTTKEDILTSSKSQEVAANVSELGKQKRKLKKAD
jgi:hypothetical protein